jgi:hypothetical protein
MNLEAPITVDGQELRPCRAPGCCALIPRSKLFCTFDWQRAPRELRHALMQTWYALLITADLVEQRKLAEQYLAAEDALLQSLVQK